MNVEIVAIGTELLLGQITDTNSAEIAKALTAIGMDCHYQTRVGDNLDRMVNALSLALSRSDMVITCGGLGPTQDDITRDAIARVMNVPLHRDPQLLARVASVFENRKRPFLPINEVQADLPEGAIPMTALPGTAPGLICPIKNTHQVIYAVPGVPSEMREMLFVDILPDIKKRKPNQELILSHTFYCLGIGESKIAELLTPRFNALASLGNPTLAYLASDTIGVRVRLTAKAATKQEAQTLLQREADIIRPMLLSHCYIETEDDETTWSPERVLLSRLIARQQTLCCAESLTGGLIGQRFTATPGASAVFLGGLIAYASNVKYDLLGVPAGNVVNEATARHMAQHARTLFKADFSVAATGVAGPKTQEGVDVGTVCIAVASPTVTKVNTFYFGNRDRDMIRHLSATAAFQMLLKFGKK